MDLPMDLQLLLSDFFVSDPDPTESCSPDAARDVRQFLSVLASRFHFNFQITYLIPTIRIPDYKDSLLSRFASTREHMDKYLKECHKVDTTKSDMKKIVESTKNEVSLWTRV